MELDLRRLLVGGLLLVAVGASGWALHTLKVRTPGVGPAPPVEQGPDYSIEDFQATVMGPDGQRKYTISAPLLQHYPQEQAVRLTEPRLLQFREGRALVEARADQGWLHDSHKEVVLSGNVRVLHRSGGAGRPSETTTTELRILLR